MRSIALAILLPLALTGCVRGYFADQETRSLCEKDGGIRIFESVKLPLGRFPTIIPDKEIPTWKPLEGVIFGKYRYTDDYTTISSHGYIIYRHRTGISRIEDGKVLGELVSYVRQGEPEFPGISCPDGATQEKLMNGVFHIPGEVTEPYRACPQDGQVERIALQDTASVVLTNSRVRVSKPPNNRDWARGINCDERTAIDRWYERANGSVTLTATRLQFLGQDNHRCQAFAIPDLRSVVCTADAVFALGFEGSKFVIQKFSLNGELIKEAEINGVALGALSGYRETDGTITVDTARIDSSDHADCYSSTLRKSSSALHGAMPRVGPPDGSIAVRECSPANQVQPSNSPEAKR